MRQIKRYSSTGSKCADMFQPGVAPLCCFACKINLLKISVRVCCCWGKHAIFFFELGCTYLRFDKGTEQRPEIEKAEF